MLTTLPVAIFLVVPLVFVVTAGEIDLSFPATMGFAAWIFALRRAGRLRPVPRHRRGDRRPASLLGFCVGALVVYASLSSLIATLGMNFMLRGLILIITEGKSIALVVAPRELGLQDLLQLGLRHAGADLLGDRLRRLLGLPLQPPPLRRAGACRRRQSRQRPADGHRRQARARQDVRLRRASARRSPASSRR